MSKSVDVGAADLAEGVMKAVAAEGQELLVAHVGDQFYAAQDRCPHLGGRLSGGVLEDTIVVCPRHGSRFDLRDGRVDRWTEFSGLTLSLARAMRPPQPLRTYPVRVEDGRLLVEVEP